MVRNFDIDIVKADGLAQMRVSGFLNYDEAHASPIHREQDTDLLH